jgi:hypothetical protein
MVSATEEIYTHQIGSDQPGADYDLLLKCIRRALHVKEPESLGTPADCINWPRVLSLAHRHEVLPLLNIALRDFPGVPAPQHQSLECYCRTVVAHNLSLASELVELLDAFESAHLFAVPFKGPAWTVALYGSLGLRQIADLDIFIDKRQAGEVFKLLVTRGYTLAEKFKTMAVEEIRLQHKDVELIHPETGIHLELHWAACEPFFDRRLSTLMFWEPAWTTTVLHRQMTMPSAEDVFFLLALHGLRHRWESLKWICDIAALIGAYPALDWATVLSKATKLSRRRMVLLPLALVHRLLDVPLPASVLKAISQDSTIPVLVRQLQRQHYSEQSSPAAQPRDAVFGFVYRQSVLVRAQERFKDRMQLLGNVFFGLMKPTASDRGYFSPHTMPEPLCWFVRPFRLLSIYGPACILRLTGHLLAPLCKP